MSPNITNSTANTAAPLSRPHAPSSRRRFLKNTAAALAAGALFPAIAPSRALGRDGFVAPSNRIALGVVGAGQGAYNLNRCYFNDVQVVAGCDADTVRLQGLIRGINGQYKRDVAKGYQDFREMFAKANLDAVILAAPDHWHAIMAIAAARAGIDIWGEKPLGHTLAEGRAIVNAVKQHGVVWQTGSWQRSLAYFRRVVELVRNGRIGKVSHVEVGTCGDWGRPKRRSTGGTLGKPPAHLDYEMWLGPAQYQDFNPDITHYNWRWVLNFGGGNLMDWVGHHLDIAHWAMRRDDTGPVKIEPEDVLYSTPEPNAPFDAERRYRYKCTYADGLVITVGGEIPPGAKFYGENGKWIYVDRGRPLQASDPEILKDIIGPDEEQVYRSDNHWRNWFDCIRTRQTTSAPVEIGHRSASVGHLGHIAIQTGRAIHWDPVTETIKGDPAASALLYPAYRAPWAL
jgi:predicted dehydrogenase